MAAWGMPILTIAAAFVGVNKWLDRKLEEQQEDKIEEETRDKRYYNLAEGVVPDLYQFYQEMDGVIVRMQSKEAEEKFCENMSRLVDFLCICNEPEGNPTVQNLMTMAMSAVNSSPGPVPDEIAAVIRKSLMGEIKRTSPDRDLTEKALVASAAIIRLMFPVSQPCQQQHVKLRNIKKA